MRLYFVRHGESEANLLHEFSNSGLKHPLTLTGVAQAQALAGEVDQAVATFERAVAAINDVGLLGEEVDAVTGEMIGNFPQAFSHIGLVNAAWAIAQAQERAASHADLAVPAGLGRRS